MIRMVPEQIVFGYPEKSVYTCYLKGKQVLSHSSLTGLVFSVSFSTTTAVPYANSSVM